MLRTKLIPVASPTPGVFRLRFEVRNDGPDTLHLLKWFTPLEGLWSNCLDVRHEDGKRIPYDGRLAKRAAPGANDYLTLAPRAADAVEFDLQEAYDMTARAGAYNVKPAPPTLDYFSASTALVHPMSTLGKQTLKKEATLEGTVVRVARGTPQMQTSGARIRSEEARRPKTTAKMSPSLAKKVAPLEPQFVGGTVTQQSHARQAHFDGYALAAAALTHHKKGSRYTEWFGKYAASRFKRVKDNYTKIKRDMETKTFTYDLTGTGCQPSWFAYTHIGTTTIWMCGAFWTAPQNGTDSKAGTIVHEHGHASADLDDIQYTQANCRQLASDEPAEAVLNADTHEYYARG